MILPVFNSSHRKILNEYIGLRNVVFDSVISIETSEIIYNAIKNNLGIGYILYDIVKKDIKDKKMIMVNIKEELPKVSLNLIYNESMISVASKEFIKRFIKNI